MRSSVQFAEACHAARVASSPELLTPEEVAQLLRVSVHKLKEDREKGRGTEFNKDLMDTPYVVLWTTTQFQGVHARFASAGGLSGLSKGAHIVVRCRGDNQVLGSPQLRDCVLE